MPRYATTAAQYGLAKSQAQSKRFVIALLILAAIVAAIVMLASAVHGGPLVAPRYHRHYA